MTLLCSFSRRPRSRVRGITGTSSPPESLVKRQHGSCETEIGHFWGGWIGSGSLYLLRIYIARLLQTLVVAMVRHVVLRIGKSYGTSLCPVSDGSESMRLGNGTTADD
jgi:hypothetical protein